MSWKNDMDWQAANGYKKETDEIYELIEYIRNTRNDNFCSSNLMRELYDFSFLKSGRMIRSLNKIGRATLEGFRFLEKKGEL